MPPKKKRPTARKKTTAKKRKAANAKRNPTKAALLRSLRKRKGVRSPEGLAAYLGRKAHGVGSMASKAGTARKGKKRGTYKKRG